LLHAFGNAGQHLITGSVPERVVNLLEIVHIDHDDRKRAVVALCLVKSALGQLEEVAAVGQTGQSVNSGETFESGLGLLAFLNLALQFNVAQLIDFGILAGVFDIVDDFNGLQAAVRFLIKELTLGAVEALKMIEGGGGIPQLFVDLSKFRMAMDDFAAGPGLLGGIESALKIS